MIVGWIRVVVTIWVSSVIVIRLTVVIVVRVAGSIVRIVIPRVESPPGTANKDKHAVVMEVGVMPVPIAMPVVRVMPLGRVVFGERLTVCYR